jgi:DNA polymerase III subunit epsilon
MSQRALALTRPLVAFDLETTGLNPAQDRIVEVSCVKLHPDGRREVKTRRLNPTVPISAEAAAIHGITDADVAGEPTFIQVAKSLATYLDGCDLTGFNLEQFDLPMLAKEFERAGLVFPKPDVCIVDTRRIWLAKEPRNLSAAYQFYCGKTLEHAHSAEYDAAAAADILAAQIGRYGDLPCDISDLHDFCHPTSPDWIDSEGKIVWREDAAVLGFGRHRNRRLDELVKEEPDYLRWVMTQDFSREVVGIIEAALDGRFPSRPAAA